MEKIRIHNGKKIKIKLFCATLVIVLLIFSVIQTVRAEKYEKEATLLRQMALTSLDENLNNISTNLEKTIYVSTSEMLSGLSSELWREASNAKISLSILPTNDNTVSSTYKFLSQIGEFVMSLERKAAKGETLTYDERERLRELYSFCTKLNKTITQMCHNMQNGSFSFEDINSTIMTEDELIFASDGFDDTEQTLTDVPTLIYDGPFSDHLTDGEAEFLKNEKEITKEKALLIAENICNYKGENLIFSHEENGEIPCYVFKNELCTIAITKRGGKPCYMLNSSFSGESKIKYSEAVKNAKAYLEQIGYSNIKETYYYTDDGICTINFAAVYEDVTLYPDLIKASVCLEKGEILSFDATGYIANHKSRSNLTRKLSMVEAEDILNNQLQVISSQVCVIPTDWDTEILCYEFHCKADEQELLVYIDCNTGAESDILILLYNDGGVLTK